MPLTKKQIRLAARLYSASILVNSMPSASFPDLPEEEAFAIEAEVRSIAGRILGIHPDFGETDSILAYITGAERPNTDARLP